MNSRKYYPRNLKLRRFAKFCAAKISRYTVLYYYYSGIYSRLIAFLLVHISCVSYFGNVHSHNYIHAHVATMILLLIVIVLYLLCDSADWCYLLYMYT